MMIWGQVKAVQKVFGCLYIFKLKIVLAVVHSLHMFTLKTKVELQNDGLHKEYPFSGPHIHFSCQFSDV